MQHETETNYNFDQDPSEGGSETEQGQPAVEGYSAPIQKKSGLSSSGLIEVLKKNWLYAAIGLVGIIIVWYLFTSFLFPSEPVKPVAGPVARHTPQQQWVEPSPKPVVQKAKSDTQTPTPVVVNNSMSLSRDDMRMLVQGFQHVVNQEVVAISQHVDQSIAQLAQSNQQGRTEVLKNQQMSQQEISIAKQQVTLLKEQVADINTKFDQYNQNLLKMGQTLEATQEQLRLLVAEKAQDAEQLTLRAVVPGRAWLVNADGHTVTVIKGTSLPHYGTITKIDSDEGKVYTSSGYVFN